MTEPNITLQDIATLAALANGIIPADERDAGAALVHAGPGIAERMRRSPYAAIYVDGLKAAHDLSQSRFGKMAHQITTDQVHDLLAGLREESPLFFRQLRADVCALYLSDAAVWQRIGFPGAATDLGGYPDFDQPQH
jgi:Gluconate 2-dehydrogenase subunit 3